MKVAVTGGRGWLGSHIASALIEAGHEVTVIDLNPHAPVQMDLSAAKLEKGDITDQRRMLEIFTSGGIEVVVHSAAMVTLGFDHASYKDRFYKVNVMGTEAVISAAEESGTVRGFVYTCSSTATASGRSDMKYANEADTPLPPTSVDWYGKTKGAGEVIVLKANCAKMGTVSLRPSIILGRRPPHIFETYLNGGGVSARTKAKVDWVALPNVVDAHVAAVERVVNVDSPVRGNAYYIGNEEPVCHTDHYKKMQGKLGNRVTIVPMWLAVTAVNVREWPMRCCGGKPPTMGRAVIKYMQYDHTLDCSAAKRDLGYKVRVSYEEQVDELCNEILAEREAAKKRS